MGKKMALAILLPNFLLVSNALAGEVLGYPVTPTQARFYILILGLIGFSIGLVASAYFAFWILDLKKKKVLISRRSKKTAFAGELVAAAQPAK
jgi:hypothetical protein